MIVEQAIAAILAPVFGDEIYPVQHPDPDGEKGSVADLYAIYTKVGGQSFQTLEGDIDLSQPRMQVSIYSVDYKTLKMQEKAVNDAMRVASNTGVLLNYSASVPVDGFETETRRFYVHMDFYCWSDGE